MTQKDKILNLLKDNHWHCTSEIYAMFMSDPRTILANMLNHEKYELEKRYCKRQCGRAHRGSPKQWRFAKKQLVPVFGQTKPETKLGESMMGGYR